MSTLPPTTPQPPLTLNTTKEPLGITPHLKKVGELIKELGDEITALQRIEKALKEAHDRLERHTSLMVIETQLVTTILKRDPERVAVELAAAATKRVAVSTLPADKLADRVEEDLKRLAPMPPVAAATPVAMPITKR